MGIGEVIVESLCVCGILVFSVSLLVLFVQQCDCVFVDCSVVKLFMEVLVDSGVQWFVVIGSLFGVDIVGSGFGWVVFELWQCIALVVLVVLVIDVYFYVNLLGIFYCGLVVVDFDYMILLFCGLLVICVFVIEEDGGFCCMVVMVCV